MATEAEQSSENGMFTHEDVHFRKKNYIQMDQEDNNLGSVGTRTCFRNSLWKGLWETLPKQIQGWWHDQTSQS